ncbi:MAG: hypothetical protein HC853_03355 [Anaerolineae bacterium]|nr:hypothetical protein [Anaerolineae bacterium]
MNRTRGIFVAFVGAAVTAVAGAAYLRYSGNTALQSIIPALPSFGPAANPAPTQPQATALNRLAPRQPSR